MSTGDDSLYTALRRILLLAVALMVLTWFLFQVREIILLFLFASSIAIVLNSPITWLEDRGLSRLVAMLLVFGVIVVALALLAWLVVPRLAADLSALLRNLPAYLDGLRDRWQEFLAQYPGLSANLGIDPDSPTGGIPSASGLLRSVGRYSLSLLGWVVLVLFLLSVIIYMLAYPRPLLAAYQQLFPLRWREAGTRAFIHASQMIVGWAKADLIAGGIEAVVVSLVLSLLGVPSALVWGALAFFAELVPRLGLFLMALPPILVTLAIDPVKAIWVAVFFIVLDQVMGHLVLPRLHLTTMELHPVLALFAILALAAAFGVVGALLAVPLAAIFKAYYRAFFLDRQSPDPESDERVDQMLRAAPFRRQGDEAG